MVNIKLEVIVTDSGGLQKEAFFLKKIEIVLRNETEWTELVDMKFNVLTGTESDVILETFNNFEFNKTFDNELFGRGNASEIIIKHLENNLCAEYSE